VASSSRVWSRGKKFFLNLKILENEEATFLPKVKKQSPWDSASHPRTKSSTTLLLTSQNSMLLIRTVNLT